MSQLPLPAAEGTLIHSHPNADPRVIADNIALVLEDANPRHKATLGTCGLAQFAKQEVNFKA